MNEQKFYLEISPMASGKTYRIAQDIAKNAFNNPDFRAGYCPPTYHMFSHMKEQLEKLGVNSDVVFWVSKKEDVVPTFNTKYYFDEFDYCGWINPDMLEDIIKADVCFLSNSYQLRTYDDLDPEKSVLGKLLQLNNGYYVGRTYHSGLSNMTIIKDVLYGDFEEDNNKVKIKFLGQFLK